MSVFRTIGPLVFNCQNNNCCPSASSESNIRHTVTVVEGHEDRNASIHNKPSSLPLLLVVHSVRLPTIL